MRFLLDAGPFDLNQIATMKFSDADQEQLAQLIGYSVGGFGELSYVSEATWARIPEEEGTKPMSASENLLGVDVEETITLAQLREAIDEAKRRYPEGEMALKWLLFALVGMKAGEALALLEARTKGTEG